MLKAGECVVGTFNVRAFTFNDPNGIGNSEVVLKLGQKLGCNVVGF